MVLEGFVKDREEEFEATENLKLDLAMIGGSMKKISQLEWTEEKHVYINSIHKGFEIRGASGTWGFFQLQLLFKLLSSNVYPVHCFSFVNEGYIT